MLTAMAHGGGKTVDAIIVERVAGIARRLLSLRQPGIEVQHPTQVGLGLGDGVGRGLELTSKRLKTPEQAWVDVHARSIAGRFGLASSSVRGLECAQQKSRIVGFFTR